MADEVLRIFTFASVPGEVLLDPALREEVVPGLLGSAGIGSVYVGRRDGKDVAERVIASVWRAAPAAARGAIEARQIDVSGLTPLIDDAREEQLDLAVSVRGRATDEPAIMRVFRGQVRPGELDVYLEEVQSGALADAASNDGIVCLHLGARPPDRFITFSIWTGWTPIEVATGGDIRDPMRTRNGQRIAAHSVAHYEIVASGSRQEG